MTYLKTVDRLLKPDKFKLGTNGIRIEFRGGRLHTIYKSGHRMPNAIKWRKLGRLQQGYPRLLDICRNLPF